MNIAIVSLFPDIFTSYNQFGVVGRAVQRKLVNISCYNPRDYSLCKHKNVDDRPFGGGAGMVIRPEPVVSAIKTAKQQLGDARVIYLSPQGRPFSQQHAEQLATLKQPLILLAGRYEGIDERVISHYVDDEYSIGDYILSGGELPALVMMDSVIRLLPGVLGDSNSKSYESFSTELSGLLEYPHYTRPVEFDGHKVPDVLRGGNHEKIARWRHKQSLGRTWLRRPNLLECVNLTNNDNLLLDEFKQEFLDRSD